jgi:hypothetical protein
MEVPFHHSEMQSYLRWVLSVERSDISEVLERFDVIAADSENILVAYLIRILLFGGIVVWHWNTYMSRTHNANR